MKKLLALFVTAIVTLSAQAQTADQIINNYLVAAGGKARLQKIKSLQYVQTMNLSSPLGTMSITMTQIKVKGKLLRYNTSSELLGNAYSVITDTSGWIKIKGGSIAGDKDMVQQLKPEEIKAFSSQMNCEGFFPELVDYAAKGFVATLAGDTAIDGRPSYKIKLRNSKMTLLYCFDKQSALVNAVQFKGASAAALSGMAKGDLEKLEINCSFSHYKEVNGIKFPGKMIIHMPMGTLESTIGFISINPVIDSKWYRAE